MGQQTDLAKAIQVVIADTRENTDPKLTDLAALVEARTCTEADLAGGVDDPKMREAYRLVIRASMDDLKTALGSRR